MKFGLCRFVVLDNGNRFKGTFVTMCKSLDRHYDILAKRNELSIENFYRFFNKATTTKMEDKQSYDVFVPAETPAGYAWNSAPIGRTDILRSTVAIDR